MSKNITIAEDGVSRNFTAKKLKTNLQGSGSCTWIPEDEAADYCTFKELKVTANGTYKASDKNCDGFDKVKVEISADVVPQKTITTNGEYDAMQDDGRVGYAHVTVNVPGGGGGPFTVLFLDDEGNVLKKQENVPYGGYASCTALDGTILNGLYFKGWNPVPKNVQFNMTCRPVRGDYVITPGEIADDWETIVADGGAHYPLGAYKPIVFNIPENTQFSQVINHVWYQGDHDYYDGCAARGRNSDSITVPAQNIACHMVKVAEGEDGSTSTWISDGMIDITNTDLYSRNYYVNGTSREVNVAWNDSRIRKWLNEDVFAAMPEIIKNNIKEVNKTYRAYDLSPSCGWQPSTGTSAQILDKTSIDSVWVPSMKEFHTFFAVAPNYAQYSTIEELSGIDYSSVFIPLFSANPLFRSIGTINNFRNPANLEYNYSNGYINGFNILGRFLFGFCL